MRGRNEYLVNTNLVFSLVSAVFAGVLLPVAGAGVNQSEGSPASIAPNADDQAHMYAGSSEEVTNSLYAGDV